VARALNFLKKEDTDFSGNENFGVKFLHAIMKYSGSENFPMEMDANLIPSLWEYFFTHGKSNKDVLKDLYETATEAQLNEMCSSINNELVSQIL